MTAISQYIKKVSKHLASGQATEHTYRSTLEELIKAADSKLTIINEPKHIACGAPDLIVTGPTVPLGYIETKNIGTNLDQIHRSDQMKRYLKSLGNLILTDYLEFRWYVDGEHRLTVRLATPGPKGKLRTRPDGPTEFVKLIDAFLKTRAISIATPKELAQRMAGLARLIRDLISKALQHEPESGSLHSQMDGFRKVLLHDLTADQFADMYAQTICYGLFAACCNHKGSARFTRQQAAHELPKTNPFLRKMFGHIAGPELDARIAWAVDDLAELLDRADIAAIQKDFGRRTRREDPVVHFYETFLAAYHPMMRKSRGVYYTPEPVVSYIVRSIDHILKTDFGLRAGLADSSMIDMFQTVKQKNGKIARKKIGRSHKVLILDPACGTGTFLYSVVDHIHETFKGNKGMWSGYVSKHLLPRWVSDRQFPVPGAV